MTDEGFLGASPALLRGLGKLAIAAGRLEGQADQMAAALSFDSRKMGFRGTVREIKARASVLPAYAVTTAQQVQEWAERAFTLTDQRNQLLHAIFQLQRQDGTWEPRLLSLRGGAASSDPETETSNLAHDIAGLWKDGNELVYGLCRQPRTGIYLLQRSDGPGWQILAVHSEKDGFPDRPTEQEQDEWWARWHADFAGPR